MHCGISRQILTTFSDFTNLHLCEIGMKFLAALGIWEGKIQIPWHNKKWTLFYAKTQSLPLHSHGVVSSRGFPRCVYSTLFAYLWLSFHGFYLLFVWDTPKWKVENHLEGLQDAQVMGIRSHYLLWRQQLLVWIELILVIHIIMEHITNEVLNYWKHPIYLLNTLVN